jgi:ribosomal protein L11
MAEEEKVKKIAELRGLLEKRIETMGTELEGLRVLLGFIDDTLLEKGFKRAEIVKPVITPAEAVPQPAAMEYERGISIKTVAGDLLADLYMEEDSMRIVLAEDKSFDINTPPFTSFLVERVLAKMQEKDREAASTGEITPDKILSYNIVRDGDLIREITIRNIRKERLGELKSSIRWTLEKMYEKTMQTT